MADPFSFVLANYHIIIEFVGAVHVPFFIPNPRRFSVLADLSRCLASNLQLDCALLKLPVASYRESSTVRNADFFRYAR